MGLTVEHDRTMESLVALDRKPLNLRDTAIVQLQRLDGSVHLPCCRVTAVFVDSLGTVASSHLIGADVIASAGGVGLEYDDDHQLSGVTFGKAEVVAAAASNSHLLTHVPVEQRGNATVLSTDDGEVTWDCTARRWVLSWKWKDGSPPADPVGHGVGE